MKKLAFATVIAASAISAQAQSAHFEGLSAGINLNLLANSTKYTGPDYSFDGNGRNATGASLQAAYGFSVSKDVVVSLGATYSLSSSDMFRDQEGDGDAVKSKIKNAYSLYVEPGYLVSDTTLAYAKVSYEAASATLEEAGTVAFKKSLNGTGIGFGIRTMINKNLSIQAEVKRVTYRSITSDFFEDGEKLKISSTVGSIGLGYKF